jgi:hypothetical protein
MHPLYTNAEVKKISNFIYMYVNLCDPKRAKDLLTKTAIIKTELAP